MFSKRYYELKAENAAFQALLISQGARVDQVEKIFNKLANMHKKELKLLEAKFTKELELQRVQMSGEFNKALLNLEQTIQLLQQQLAMAQNAAATHPFMPRTAEGESEIYDRYKDRPISDHIPGGE